LLLKMVVYWNEEMWKRNKEAEWWMGFSATFQARAKDWLLGTRSGC
jgi:hypothetical protein